MSRRTWSILFTLSRVGCVALIALSANCAGQSTRRPPSPNVSRNDSSVLGRVSTDTANAATVRVEPNCPLGLQAAMVSRGSEWYVSWEAIKAHVATLPIEPHGEDNHLLLPQMPNAPAVHASIRSIAGTETLTE